MSDVQHITVREGAALLMRLLESKGATFELNAHGALRANLDAVVFPVGQISGPKMVQIVLSLADDLKAILRSEQVLH